jgi:hypothetical protein
MIMSPIVAALARTTLTLLTLLSSTPRLLAQEADTSTKTTTVESSTADRLREIITYLSETIGERNLSKPKKLGETVAYIRTAFTAMDFTVEEQVF